MSYPVQPPMTGIGSLQSDVARIERELHLKANSQEISTLTYDVGRVAMAVRELTSIVSGIHTRVQKLEAKP